MGRTAYTEPQCLYSRAIPLLPLWAVRPVQSLSACTRVTFTLRFTVQAYKNCKTGPMIWSAESVTLHLVCCKVNCVNITT
jgi:hypothetical protein